MAKKIRKYAMPYNAWYIGEYINNIMKRKKYIDHVFCEFPYYNLNSHNVFMFGAIESQKDYSFVESRGEYIAKCIKFLQLSKGKFKRVCTLNSVYYHFKDAKELMQMVNNIVDIINEYSIDGIITTEYRLAVLLHKLMPSLDIHTSCNGFQWNVRQMQLWKDYVGVKLFNPPREILRKFSVLKEMHNAGFKLKCIINEGCLMGCPNTYTHSTCNSMSGYFGNQCLQVGFGDILRGNFILPRWQKYYDDYVDVYKIAGRGLPGDKPFKILDIYINEKDDVPLSDFICGGTFGMSTDLLPKDIIDSITTKDVPDKLAFCECKECNSCHLCDAVMAKKIPAEYFKKPFHCFNI